jgi:hypothetical protein
LRSHGRLKPDAAAASDAKSVSATDVRAEVRCCSIINLLGRASSLCSLAGYKHVFTARGS